MAIPIAILLILGSVSGLILGLQYKNAIVLLALNIWWWLGAFVSAYFTWLAWQDRGYSENWAMLGFIFFALPYLLLIGLMALAKLFFIRSWPDNMAKLLRISSLGLLLFLLFQLIVGCGAA